MLGDPITLENVDSATIANAKFGEAWISMLIPTCSR